MLSIKKKKKKEKSVLITIVVMEITRTWQFGCGEVQIVPSLVA